LVTKKMLYALNVLVTIKARDKKSNKRFPNAHGNVLKTLTTVHTPKVSYARNLLHYDILEAAANGIVDDSAWKLARV